jgi:hypothetical protein
MATVSDNVSGGVPCDCWCGCGCLHAVHGYACFCGALKIGKGDGETES